MTLRPFPSRRSFLLGSASLALLGPGLPDIGLLGAGRVLAQQSGFDHDKTLTIGLTNEPPTLVTFFEVDANAYTISPKMSDGLLTFDLDLNPVPQLATSWDISDDGLEAVFHLRKGVKWHDGADFTARDVEFSLRQVAEFHGRGRVNLEKVTDYVVIDDHTFKLVLSSPIPYLLLGLIPGEAPIIPRHLYEGTDVLNNPHNGAPVGTGPYRFESWERGSHISVVRNDDYWGPKPAQIERIVFRILPEANSRSIALETGEIDMSIGTPVPYSDIERLETVPGLGISWVGQDYLPLPFSMEFNFRNAVLKEQLVRQAIAHAINVDRLIENVYFGHAVKHVSPVSPFSRDYYKEYDRYPYDLDQARALLDKAGFSEGADGTRFSFRLRHGANHATYPALSEFIQASLRQVGIDVKIDVIKNAAFPPYYKSGDWDVNLRHPTNMIDPAMGLVRFLRTPKPGTEHLTHASGWSNPEMDRLINEALVESDDQKRFALWHAIQDIAVEELPRLYLFTIRPFTVYNTRVNQFNDEVVGPQGSLVAAYLAS